VGLPGEGLTEVVETARHLSSLGIDGIKFHNLVITRGTLLYRLYREDRAAAISGEAYMDLLIEALDNLAPETVVMRLTCDPPRDVKTVPEDFPDKATFHRTLNDEMRRRNVWQGRRWTETNPHMYDSEGTANADKRQRGHESH
jgi:radical SAM superfamily enzyme